MTNREPERNLQKIQNLARLWQTIQGRVMRQKTKVPNVMRINLIIVLQRGRMYVSARNSFRRGDEGWLGYIAFIGLRGLADVRSIDFCLNEVVDGSQVQRCQQADLDSALARLPKLEAMRQYYQLAVNLSEENQLATSADRRLLGYDLSDETGTSSVLNCGRWEGPLEEFTSRLNEYGLLSIEDAIRVQRMLPEVWGEVEPHALVNIWELWEMSRA